MKVLQINAVYRVGSTGRNIYELHTVMRKKGIESFIATTHMEKKEEYCYQIGSKLDWKLHGLLSRITGLQGYFSTIPTKKFIKFIENINPDIVHLNNVHANYLNLQILFEYLAQNDIPTVITLHDCWFYTGKCTHYTVDGCYKWKLGCYKCERLNKDNKSWIFDKTKKMWSDKKNWYESLPRLAVVGVSDWIINEARKSILKSARVTSKIYNWINLDIFKPKLSKMCFKLSKKYIILGVASEWSDKKGLFDFLKLSELLKDDEILILIGKMPKIQLPLNVIHINETNNVEELVEYYCVANVFLQLSKEESFGKVVAESLACGTPVVTVDSTANKELVPDSCGIVVNTFDIDKIYEAISCIRKNKKEYYSEECRKFAYENFEMEKCVQKYLNLYNKLIELQEKK